MRRSVIITGIAGGVGSATARVFKKAGWYIIGVDRRPVTKTRYSDYVLRGDISDPREARMLFRHIKKKVSGVDALVNNAALQLIRPFKDITPRQWDASMASNVRSVYCAVRETLPLFDRRNAAIVNVSSVHARASREGMSLYAASKGAVDALTRALAIEFAPSGIRVNAVLPGAVDTPMLRKNLRLRHKKMSNAALKRLCEKGQPLTRIACPDEIARVIYFLADSAQASFLTGETLIADGGVSARLSSE